MSQWLEFRKKKDLPKTKVYSLWSKCSDCELGEIKWYPAWRKYCYIQGDKVYSDRCLSEMSQFITKLNESHKSLSDNQTLTGGIENGKRI